MLDLPGEAAMLFERFEAASPGNPNPNPSPNPNPTPTPTPTPNPNPNPTLPLPMMKERQAAELPTSYYLLLTSNH